MSVFGFIFSNMLASLTEGLAARLPSQCRICHAWPSEILCRHCLAHFGQARHRCRSCAIALPSEAAICGACLGHPSPLRQCLAAVSYEFPWPRLIQDFKFQNQPALARVLGQVMLAQSDIREMVENASALIPVPLSPMRHRERGYNQATWLARALSPSKTQIRWLSRSGDLAAQHTLGRHDRLRGVQDVFTATEAWARNRRPDAIVLIDDVMTTGATLAGAARALLDAGASDVSALVFARTEAPAGQDRS